MTSRPQRRAFGILQTLSPEMAKDLGDAFSLARIGARPGTKSPREPGDTARWALRLVGRVAAFLLVAVVAVSLTVTAMYLMPLP